MSVNFNQIFWAALFTLSFGYFMCWYGLKLPRKISVIVSLVKVLLPVLYFTMWFNRAWVLLDDVIYFRLGDHLTALGYNPFTMLFHADERQLLISLAGGPHFLYIWWNVLAEYVFGPTYASPVFLNVATTFVSAYLLSKIARVSGKLSGKNLQPSEARPLPKSVPLPLSKTHKFVPVSEGPDSYSKWLAIFFMFQWDLLAWSSLVNLKDPVIMMITLSIVYSGLRLLQTQKLKYALPLAASVFVVLWIRYYVAFFLLGALAVYAVLAVRGWKKIPWAFSAAVFAFLATPHGSIGTFRSLSSDEWISGPVRELLTPRPWSIEQNYSYLFLPSIFHWAFFLPAVYAGVRLFRKNHVFRFAAIHFVALIVFYGLVSQLGGPRERLQVCWVLAWAQFDFLWLGLSSIRRKVANPPQPRLAARRTTPASHQA